MTGDVTPYLNRITSEHSDKPNFLAVMTAILQPFADNLAVLQAMPTLFDLDTAVGDQLDKVGEWIGRKRNLQTPITNLYFTFDTSGLGWDQAIWKGPFDPVSEITVLNDTTYRALLRFTAKANYWDGTKWGAYEVWNALLVGFSGTVQIVDNQDMSMSVTFSGADFDNVTKALIASGEALLSPIGVGVTVNFT